MLKKSTLETRGRPRKDRVKVGLSLSRKSSEKLNKITVRGNRTKSKVIEDLITFYDENEEIVNARLKKMESDGLTKYFDFDEIRKVRESKK